MDEERGPKLTVVLLNWQHEPQTLSAVQMVRGWRRVQPRLLVVDNASTARSRQTLRAELAADELLCSERNLGFGGGNNLALRILRRQPGLVMLLNTDATIEEDAVLRLICLLEQHPEMGMIGPAIVEAGSDQVIVGGRDIGRYLNTRATISRAAQRDRLRRATYVPGTVFLTRCRLFAEIGLLDEAYFFSGEIAEFCRRAAERGYYSCVALDVTAEHNRDHVDHRRHSLLYLYYSLRNRFLYVRQHHAGQQIVYIGYWIATGKLLLLNALLRLRFAKARAIFLAVEHGLFNKFGNRNYDFINSERRAD